MSWTSLSFILIAVICASKVFTFSHFQTVCKMERDGGMQLPLCGFQGRDFTFTIFVKDLKFAIKYANISKMIIYFLIGMAPLTAPLSIILKSFRPKDIIKACNEHMDNYNVTLPCGNKTSLAVMQSYVSAIICGFVVSGVVVTDYEEWRHKCVGNDAFASSMVDFMMSLSENAQYMASFTEGTKRIRKVLRCVLVQSNECTTEEILNRKDLSDMLALKGRVKTKTPAEKLIRECMEIINMPCKLCESIKRVETAFCTFIIMLGMRRRDSGLTVSVETGKRRIKRPVKTHFSLPSRYVEDIPLTVSLFAGHLAQQATLTDEADIFECTAPVTNRFAASIRRDLSKKKPVDIIEWSIMQSQNVTSNTISKYVFRELTLTGLMEEAGKERVEDLCKNKVVALYQKHVSGNSATRMNHVKRTRFFGQISSYWAMDSELEEESSKDAELDGDEDDTETVEDRASPLPVKRGRVFGAADSNVSKSRKIKFK